MIPYRRYAVRRHPTEKSHDVSSQGFHQRLLEETLASVGFTSMGLATLRGGSCTNRKGQRVYSLLALEYRNTKGETFRVVHSFGVTDGRIMALISLLTRIFP